MIAHAGRAAKAATAGAAASGNVGRAAEPMARAGAVLTKARLDQLLDRQSGILADAARRLDRDVHRRLAGDTDRAESRRAVLEAYDPRRQLARGWTLTHTPAGRLLRHVDDVAVGDTLVTTFADGAATSTVSQLTPHDHEDADQ